MKSTQSLELKQENSFWQCVLMNNDKLQILVAVETIPAIFE